MKKWFFLALLLVAVPAFGADLTLKWDAVLPAGSCDGYSIYTSNDAGVTWGTALDVGNVTTRALAGVAADRRVYFKISCYKGTGASRVEAIRHWSGAWHDERLKPPPAPGGAGIQ